MTSSKIHTVAINWNQHRRFTEICDFFEIPLSEFTHDGSRFFRYMRSMCQSVRLIIRAQPRVVLIQSPSLVLALFVNVIKHVFRFKVVMDAHNESVVPFVSKSRAIRFFTDVALHQSELTIVTNSHLAKIVKAKGGKAVVLPDRVPKCSVGPNEDRSYHGGQFEVAVICTCAPDEPIPVILDAARQLGDSVQFYVSGSRERFLDTFGHDLPGNVSLSGFMKEDVYWHWLSTCHVVLDLTEMPDCLVCGSYEALSVGTPSILTDNRATRWLFGEWAVLTPNSVPGIVSAVTKVRNAYGEIKDRTLAFRPEYDQTWTKRAKDVGQKITQ